MSEPPRIVHSTDEQAMGAGLSRTSGYSHVRQEDRLRSPHTQRFRTATAVLVGFAIGALVIAAAVLVSAGSSPNQTGSAPWSAWSPPDTGTLAARDIADRLAPLYRISSVDQLAVVTVVNLESSSTIAAQQSAAANGTTPPAPSGLEVAVHPDPRSSAVSLLTGNTIAYNLCGIGGKNCSIGVGTPSTACLLLLRREALELALYTFKYIPSASNVVAVLPPSQTQQTSILSRSLPTSDSTSQHVDMAILFERQELGPLLTQPLSDTLPEEFPPSVATMPTAPEAGLVDQVTARGLFSEQLQQAQDGSNLIVLNPLPPS